MMTPAVFRSPRIPLLVLACAALGLAACGPDGSGEDADGGAESGTGQDSGPPTDTSAQLTCFYVDTEYENGEEFDSPDGCIRFICESGVLNIAADNLVTVEGDLTLSTQEEVDAQACLSAVNGQLTITGTGTDFAPIRNLNSVDADLVVTGSEAVTIAGFGNALSEVGGSIILSDNPNLTTMDFNPNMSVFGDVTIQNNDALTSLAGVEFIGQCGFCSVAGDDPPRADTIQFVDPAAAGDDAADGGGQDPGNEFDGGGAPADDGADEPGGGTYYGAIIIADNDVLTDISALGNLYFAWSDVRFQNNPVLAELGAMPLTEVQGDLEISGHPTMPDAAAQSYASGIDVWGTLTVCGNLDGTACQ